MPSLRGEAHSRGQIRVLPSQHRPVTPSKAEAQPREQGHTSTITLAWGCWVFIRRTMASIPPATSSAVFSWLFVPTQTTMTCKERKTFAAFPEASGNRADDPEIPA